MSWIVTSILSAGIWAGTLSAQSVQPEPTIIPQAPAVRPEAKRALRQWMKKFGQQSEAAVCSIPLLEVLIAKDIDRMPHFKPRDEPENIDRMPPVKMPAPPCKEEKR
jgi:hypothetical protein